MQAVGPWGMAGPGNEVWGLVYGASVSSCSVSWLGSGLGSPGGGGSIIYLVASGFSDLGSSLLAVVGGSG